MGRRGYAWSWMEVGTHGDGGLRVDRTGVGFLGGVRGREAALSTEQAGRAEGCGKQEISVRVEISALVKVRFSSGSSCSLVRH